MTSKSVNYRKIGIFLITAILIIGIVAYFVVPAKAESFDSYYADSIFGNDGNNLLADYVDSHISYDFVDNNFGDDTMLVITNGSGSSYYLGTWYFSFNTYSYPYGYEVLSSLITCMVDWHIVGGTGYFGSSSILFELWDESAHEPVAQDSINFQDNTNTSGSLSFSSSLGTSLYYGHVYSIKLTINIRWAVNFSNAALYLSNARCLQNLTVSGNTLPPLTTRPHTPTPAPTPTPTPAPTITLPPVLSPPPDRTLGPLPSVPSFSDSDTQAFMALSTFWFQPITSWSFFPVIIISLLFGALGTLATLFSVTRKGGK